MSSVASQDQQSRGMHAQAADVHILMVERGHLDDICQLTATLIINNQAPLLVRVLISIVDDRVRCPNCAAPAVVAFNKASQSIVPRPLPTDFRTKKHDLFQHLLVFSFLHHLPEDYSTSASLGFHGTCETLQPISKVAQVQMQQLPNMFDWSVCSAGQGRLCCQEASQVPRDRP